MQQDNSKDREPEHQGPWWKHPYMLYVIFSVALFFVLIVAGWLAIENDWIPKR